MVRHRGVGMNKAKKKKVLQPVAVPVVVKETADPEQPSSAPALEPEAAH